MSMPPQGQSDSAPLSEDHAPLPWHEHEFTRRQVIAVSGGVLAATQMNAWSATEASASGPSENTVGVRFTINGRLVELQVDARQSLLDVLRERLNLTGTKKGCNQGACGACTVLVDGRRINACLTLAAMHDGAEITTVEGLATEGSLHPLQAAFIEHEGFQCGYCTAGQLMSGVACIREGHAKTAGEVQVWMSGNICRCGAYPGIVSAVIEVARSQAS
jgi:xanthine dehydrogenase YagT iron-sulfur-binding subunit